MIDMTDYNIGLVHDINGRYIIGTSRFRRARSGEQFAIRANHESMKVAHSTWKQHMEYKKQGKTKTYNDNTKDNAGDSVPRVLGSA